MSAPATSALSNSDRKTEADVSHLAIALPAHEIPEGKTPLLASLDPQDLQASALKLASDINTFMVDCFDAMGGEPGTNAEILGLLFFSDPNNLHQSLLTYVRETHKQLFEHLTIEENMVKLYSLCAQITSIGLSDEQLDPFFANEAAVESGFDSEAFAAVILQATPDKLSGLQILQRQAPSFYAALCESLELVGARLQNLELAISDHVDDCPDLIKLHSQISFRNARILGSEIAIVPVFPEDGATDVSMAIFKPQQVNGFLYGHDFTELVYPRRYDDQIVNYAVTLSTIKIDARIMNLLAKVADLTGEPIDRRIYAAISEVYQQSDHDYLHHLTSLSPDEVQNLANVIKDEELLSVLHNLTVDLWEPSPELDFLPMEALAIRINYIATSIRGNTDSESALARQAIVDRQAQFIEDLVKVQRVLTATDQPLSAEVGNYLLYVYCARLFQIFNIHETTIDGPTDHLAKVNVNAEKETSNLFEFFTNNAALRNPAAVAIRFRETGIVQDDRSQVVQALLNLPLEEWNPIFAKSIQNLRERLLNKNEAGNFEFPESMSAVDKLRLHFLTSGTGYLGWVLEPDAGKSEAELLKQFGGFMQAMQVVYIDMLKAS